MKLRNFDQLFPFVELPKSKYFLNVFKLKYTFEQSYKTEQLWRAGILLRFLVGLGILHCRNVGWLDHFRFLYSKSKKVSKMAANFEELFLKLP